MSKSSTESYYGPRTTERRRQFNHLIDGLSLVLMNSIPEVDQSVYENWLGKSPMGGEDCEIEQISADGEDDGLTWFHCNTHDEDTLNDAAFGDCGYSDDSEVYQWFATTDSDAKFLANHGQYVTYSDLLSTHFLAITHWGTSWDYVDSMVEAFSDCYHGLDDFEPTEKESEAKS